MSVEFPDSCDGFIQRFYTARGGRTSSCCGSFIWSSALFCGLGLRRVRQHGETVLHQLKQENSALQHLFSLTETKANVSERCVTHNYAKWQLLLWQQAKHVDTKASSDTVRYSHLPEFTVELPEEAETEATEVEKIFLLEVGCILPNKQDNCRQQNRAFLFIYVKHPSRIRYGTDHKYCKWGDNANGNKRVLYLSI